MNPAMMKRGGGAMADEIPSPAPVDAPEGGQQQDGSNVPYIGPDQRCNSCEYFDGQGTCSKGVNGGQVDWDGYCQLFEGKAEDQGDTGADEAAEGEPASAGGGMPPAKPPMR